MKKKKVSEKHKLLLKKISDNIGNGMTFEKAMLNIGYSPSYAKSSHIKNTDSWQQLLEDSLPDSVLLKKHYELLSKEEVFFRTNSKTKKTEIVKTGQPHSDVKSALDMLYKLKGKYETDNAPQKFTSYKRDQLIDFIVSKIAQK